METGELKTLVVNTIRTLKEGSVSEILRQINEITKKEYAYTTIATITKRLEEEGIIIGEKKRKGGRRKTYYRIEGGAHKNEAKSFLEDYIKKFGDIGIKHLGDLMGAELNEKEINDLRKKINSGE